MTASPEIKAAAAYLVAAAAAMKSGAGLDVAPVDLGFAAQRLCACAGDLLAGLHLTEIEAQEAVDG
ncbi:hypothetical protein O4H52_03165 [Sphingomonadaceae bacterium G21617-S1]|nr:hypothetical protein [Sphingomonadaceae bacterium G21617-S1]